MNSNEKKSYQLGMPIGTASNRLRKSIIFKLIQKTNENICFQCGTEIESEKELSIEHKIPYLDSEDPKKLFFDLENIAFSHLSCNSASSRAIPQKRYKVSLTSGYRGVILPSKKHIKYRAQIRVNKQLINLGCFETAKEAALAYDKKAVELFGDKAITNKKLKLLV